MNNLFVDSNVRQPAKSGCLMIIFFAGLFSAGFLLSFAGKSLAAGSITPTSFKGSSANYKFTAVFGSVGTESPDPVVVPAETPLTQEVSRGAQAGSVLPPEILQPAGLKMAKDQIPGLSFPGSLVSKSVPSFYSPSKHLSKPLSISAQNLEAASLNSSWASNGYDYPKIILFFLCLSVIAVGFAGYGKNHLVNGFLEYEN